MDIIARAAHATLRPGQGDSPFFYTVSVTTAIRVAGDQYGKKRLLRCLRRSGAVSRQELVSGAVTGVGAFAGGALQSDDIDMSAVRYR